MASSEAKKAAMLAISSGVLERLSGIDASIRATAFDPISDDRAVSFQKLASGAVSLKGNLQEVVAGEQAKGIPLNEAKIIVSGGRGQRSVVLRPGSGPLQSMKSPR